MQTIIKTPKRLVNKLNRRDLKDRMRNSSEQRTTISFYKYHQIEQVITFRDHLFHTLRDLEVLGRIYVAQEGINAQISVPSHQVDAFQVAIYSYGWLNGVRLNKAIDDNGKSFFALTIKVRPKIVADGIQDPHFDPSDMGVHLDALQFNDLIAQPNTLLIDMRNHYESEVGHFEGALTPEVTTFRDSLPIISEMASGHVDQNVVMYCTGGIRCEKASAYLKYRGFKHVFQLNGGIIEYTRQVRDKGVENKFLGKNFVFDERLGERISNDVIAHCHQCGASCDDHTNCKNDQCHLLFIQCKPCATQYAGCCSDVCNEFMQLSTEEKSRVVESIVFNGPKFGRYFGKRLAAKLNK
jgi:UPF0176 protein